MKRLSAGFALVVMGLVVGLVVAELGLRLVGFSGDPVYNLPRAYARYHSLLGWEKVPNLKARFRHPEYDVELQFNSKGLRYREIPYEPEEGVQRILVLGDSFVEAYQVPSDNAFTNRLEKVLNQRSRPPGFEVVNGGTGGYSTDQEVLFYEEEGSKYRPCLAILAVFNNDVWMNTQNTYWGGFPKPKFVLDSNVLTLANVPVPPKQNWNGQGSTQEAKGTVGRVSEYLKRPLRQLAVYAVLRNTLRARAPSLTHFLIALGIMAPDPLRLADVQSPSAQAPEYLEVVYSTQPSPEQKSSWAITEALIARLQADLHRSGSDLVLLLVPAQEQVYTQKWKEMMRGLDVKEGDWDPLAFNQRLQKIAQRLDIPLVDPTDALRARAEQGQELYYPKDGHWNSKGHAAVAALLDAFLNERGLAPCPP